MIINLRGTSASGKTTIVRTLLANPETRSQAIHGALGNKQPEAIEISRPSRPLFLLGPYPNAGCDSLVSRVGVQGVIALLEKYATRGDVLFEALIISSMDGAIGEWLRANPPVIIAVLDVTLKDCRAGLSERQGDQHKAAKTQTAHYDNTLKVALRMKREGMRVEVLKREGAVETIFDWLK